MHTLSYTDELQAAHAGDPAALNELLSRSRQDLRRYAEYHCSVNDVEDAVQESLILVSRKPGSLRSLESFASWVFRIVKRECNRLKRARCQWRHEELREEILPPAQHDNLDLRRDCAAALESLPAHYREVILLRDLEGLTIAEIADHLTLTSEAVKSRLHRARMLAREYLSQ